MKICWHGFAGNLHSWSEVGHNICRNLNDLGHKISICSTNGYKFFPKDLENLKEEDLKQQYFDMQLSYTAMPNFQNYFSHGTKNRFAIWNYEFTKIPNGHIRNHIFIDKFLPSSKFSYEIFADNKFPLEKMKVIPHGIELEKYSKSIPMKLNTNKKIKILANIAQPHIRKNISGLLEAYGKAFSKKDNVCLVLKIVDKIPENHYEVSFSKCYSKYKEKYNAECLIIKDYIEDMPSLYASVDIVFTMSHAECFYLPGLEGLASGKIIISPKYGGQLEYLNDQNSLLIDGKKIRAPNEAQYWEASVHSEMFQPNIDDAISKLRFAVDNCDELNSLYKKTSKDILPNFSWKQISNDILKLSE